MNESLNLNPHPTPQPRQSPQSNPLPPSPPLLKPVKNTNFILQIGLYLGYFAVQALITGIFGGLFALTLFLPFFGLWVIGSIAWFSIFSKIAAKILQVSVKRSLVKLIIIIVAVNIVISIAYFFIFKYTDIQRISTKEDIQVLKEKNIIQIHSASFSIGQEEYAYKLIGLLNVSITQEIKEDALYSAYIFNILDNNQNITYLEGCLPANGGKIITNQLARIKKNIQKDNTTFEDVNPLAMFFMMAQDSARTLKPGNHQLYVTWHIPKSEWCLPEYLLTLENNSFMRVDKATLSETDETITVLPITSIRRAPALDYLKSIDPSITPVEQPDFSSEL